MADTSVKARGAIYTALSGDATLTALVGTRIYAGSAQQGTTYPYVVIGERETDQRFKTKDAVVQSHRIRIYSYSRKDSPLEVENIKAAIFNVLEKATLSISGAGFVDIIQDGLDTVTIEGDGRTYRSLIEFVITIQ